MRYFISLFLIVLTLKSYAPDIDPRVQKCIITRDTTEAHIASYLERYPTSPLKAEWVVYYSRKYRIDPYFMMAIAQIETQFGTDGYRCKKNKTIFSEGEWDDGTSIYSHPSWEHSVERFSILISSEYLVGEKTVEDLMQNFINSHGYRYASAENYEWYLRNTYHFIKSYKGGV